MDTVSKAGIKKLARLCEDGTLEYNENNVELDKSGAFFYEDRYFWRSPEAALNFQIQTESDKPCAYVDSELYFFQIPSEPEEEEED